MTIRAVIPPEMARICEQLKLSPAIISGNHMFLTGVTGSGADGQMPQDPAAQIRSAFEKIEQVLQHAGLTFGAVAEMTSYHVGIDQHFDIFSEIRASFVTQPYPAWTVVEVAGLRRAGAIVEIRVVANMDPEA